MKLTQAQVRQLVEIGEEKFRTWRCALSPLAARRGQSALFELADVLALRIVREMVDRFGIRISLLAPLAPELFDACERIVATNAPQTVLLVSPSTVELARRSALDAIDTITIALPISQFLDELRAQITAQALKQAPLPL